MTPTRFNVTLNKAQAEALDSIVKNLAMSDVGNYLSRSAMAFLNNEMNNEGNLYTHLYSATRSLKELWNDQKPKPRNIDGRIKLPIKLNLTTNQLRALTFLTGAMGQDIEDFLTWCLVNRIRGDMEELFESARDGETKTYASKMYEIFEGKEELYLPVKIGNQA